jgi:hypothetical protein
LGEHRERPRFAEIRVVTPTVGIVIAPFLERRARIGFV